MYNSPNNSHQTYSVQYVKYGAIILDDVKIAVKMIGNDIINGSLMN